jgi:hypothetical protein
VRFVLNKKQLTFNSGAERTQAEFVSGVETKDKRGEEEGRGKSK